MPRIQVPLTRAAPNAHTPKLSISFRVHGSGPVLVLMIPGLCVPASMYDAMSAVLSSTRQFTTVIIDNRGIGRSDAPPASLLGATGYSATELAHDAWDVVDAVRAMRARAHLHSHNEQQLLHPEIALVGHSMGGMIAQRMLALRPTQVRFAALLSTHAGGMWNLLPTGRTMWGAFQVAWSGFDRDVHAAVNLSLHFTQSFLDDWVGDWHHHHPQQPVTSPLKPPHHQTEHAQTAAHHQSPQLSNNSSYDSDSERSSTPSGTAAQSSDSNSDSTPPNSPASPNSPHPPAPHHARASLSTTAGISYVESKLLELAHDAHIHFGITRDALKRALWKPRRSLFAAIAKQHCRARRRFDIYHAMYAGREIAPEDHNLKNASSHALSSPNDSPYAMYGHTAVVRSHYLHSTFATKLRQCSRIVKLVILGRHDSVITPAASRRLAACIGANTVLEVDAAHFITDEVGAEVTMHIQYGLRKAFFAQKRNTCACTWCAKPVYNEQERTDSVCRMC
ncbi:hypothetical protein BWQ96_03029 [Gracilariopsis chorda]|uniref:AB hydrolase-1 domain-containing protein n=1 Tax=Gracilariopsis chorda TaxID=448386 RepID=A0A2V3IYN5_9FLOR|nr:hypothetical protein BWQ96_03029 [Gracilariopsis chorda]|eukprot:PXF47254.1 hypothetical protein BWQ96_03029 [Gracilariopsis chorda]